MSSDPVDAEHPTWCTRDEGPGEDHLSRTSTAAEPDDVVGVRVRLSQPGDETRLAFVEIEFADDDEVTIHVLPARQARSLADTIGRLLGQ